MSSDVLVKLIRQIVLEELSEQFATAPKMGDIKPTSEPNRPGMDRRPKDGMDIEQHQNMMHASDEEDKPIEEMNAIGMGGAALASSGHVSATSAGSAWTSNDKQHERMWSDTVPTDPEDDKKSASKKKRSKKKA